MNWRKDRTGDFDEGSWLLHSAGYEEIRFRPSSAWISFAFVVLMLVPRFVAGGGTGTTRGTTALVLAIVLVVLYRVVKDNREVLWTQLTTRWPGANRQGSEQPAAPGA